MSKIVNVHYLGSNLPLIVPNMFFNLNSIFWKDLVSWCKSSRCWSSLF